MNIVYPKARERFLTKQIDWMLDSFTAWLVTAGYQFDEAHSDFSDVPVSARLKQSTNPLAGKTAFNGVAKCNPVSFGLVLDRVPVTQIVIVHEPTSWLIWWGGAGFGLPFTPDGAEVIMFPDSQVGGFFQL